MSKVRSYYKSHGYSNIIYYVQKSVYRERNLITKAITVGGGREKRHNADVIILDTYLYNK